MCNTGMSFIKAIPRILFLQSPLSLTVHLSITLCYHPEFCSYDLLCVHTLHWIKSFGYVIHYFKVLYVVVYISV